MNTPLTMSSKLVLDFPSLYFADRRSNLHENEFIIMPYKARAVLIDSHDTFPNETDTKSRCGICDVIVQVL